MATSNPNGANDTQNDPRQEVCWNFYIETILTNKPDAQASALKAGYEPSSAKNITLTGWFKDRLAKLKRRDMLTKAEKVLEKTLDYETDYSDPETGETKVKVDLLRVQTDVAKTIATTLGKEDGYSTRVEQTGANSQPLVVTFDNSFVK